MADGHVKPEDEPPAFVVPEVGGLGLVDFLLSDHTPLAEALRRVQLGTEQQQNYAAFGNTP
jgi:hypothetical protein